MHSGVAVVARSQRLRLVLRVHVHRSEAVDVRLGVGLGEAVYVECVRGSVALDQALSAGIRNLAAVPRVRVSVRSKKKIG